MVAESYTKRVLRRPRARVSSSGQVKASLMRTKALPRGPLR